MASSLVTFLANSLWILLILKSSTKPKRSLMLFIIKMWLLLWPGVPTTKSRLKKSKQSKLEFQLRLQEFVELVRAENNLRAITYARKYLAPWGATHMKELQRVMATLAFKSNTECTMYKVISFSGCWLCLSALKTPFCYEEDCTKEDPLSQESFRKLANPLPFSKQHHSKLVCYITKELMDTENPPLVLPNGSSTAPRSWALEEMARKNDGKVTCPRTGLVCNYSELVKAFIS
ncbi:hypothetical protein IFM89_038943 [Coptis chinensis]|uniref:CTLH domain-containing protein n=1 Tax=Coptis chinensis TaxID=261450 RepID=A0A835HHV9_9MAGN|nr:hypothetical protein IFM89_038943 [Coptis chinensis]